MQQIKLYDGSSRDIPARFATEYSMYDWHVPAVYLETLRAGYQHSEYWPTWETLRATAFTVAPDGSAYGLAQTERAGYILYL